jgi:hypothetical protein
MTIRVSLAVLTGLNLALAATAQAQVYSQNLSWECQLAPCVYDGLNRPFGRDYSSGVLERPINGVQYMIDYDALGPLDNLLLYYQAADCSGQPYFFGVGSFDRAGDAMLEPPFAHYDSVTKAIWGPTGALVSLSYQAYKYGNPPYCATEWRGGSGTGLARIAAPIEYNPSIVPPFVPR